MHQFPPLALSLPGDLRHAPFICSNDMVVSTVWAMVSKTIAALFLAGSFTAALMLPLGKAAAYCDAVDCVPNVARNVVPGTPCDPQHLYDFGLDSNSNTYVCTTAGVWIPTGPLVGLREVAIPCDVLNESAQLPDGAPLKCAQVNGGLRWAYRDDTPG